MSASSGLGPVEVALLDALDLLGAYADAEPVRCADVLTAVERLHGTASGSAWPVLVGMGLPWRVHLPTVELLGDAGSRDGRPPAPPEHVEARLSTVGALVLAAERGETGPVPVGLIEGSLHRGGPVPPFSPEAVVGALLAGSTYAGGPVLPAGGTVGGDLDGLLAGDPVRLVLGCTIRDEIDRLVITEVPLGVAPDDVLRAIGAALSADGSTGGGDSVRDDSSELDGLRIVVDIDRRTNVARVLEWLRAIEPVTVGVAARLPGPMAERLRGWDRGDGTGLRALADLLRPPY